MTETQTAQQSTLGRAERDEAWSPEPVKVSMSLPGGCVENIKWLARRLGVPKSHVVRQAVDLRYRIQKEIDSGAKFLIERDGQMMAIWFD